MRVRTLEEILFPEGLAPDNHIPFDPNPALQIIVRNVPGQELSQSTLQLPMAARNGSVEMGIFDKGPIKDETITFGREGHFGKREGRDNRNGYISQHGGEIDLGDWNDIKDAASSCRDYKW